MKISILTACGTVRNFIGHSFFSTALILAPPVFLVANCTQAPKVSKPVAGKKGARKVVVRKKDTGRRISSLTPAKKYVPEIPAATGFTPRGLDYESVVSDIAFGSWANQNLQQPIWSAIQESAPNLFVFVGDTVRLDDRSFAEQYARLNALPEYRAARESVPFLAVWNTQDYKVDAQREFVQQWAYLRDAIPLQQSGLYHAKVMGPSKKQVQIILLDTRSFRGPRLAGDKPNAPVLGEAQWKWLEERLRDPAEVRLIVSTIPVIAARADGESWNNYPVERTRFFDLIKKVKPKNLAVVSGGARQGSIARTGLKGWGSLYDITTGPLNDPTDRPAEPDERFEGPTTLAENFGVVQIDWSGKLLVLKLLDSQRAILNSASLKLR